MSNYTDRTSSGLDPSVHEAIFNSEDDFEKQKRSDDIYFLMMGEKADLIDRMETDLYDEEVRIGNLGRDLPEAIVGISGDDPDRKKPSNLAVAMRRAVGDAMQLISRNEKQFLTEILSPVIGAATSKFFADASRHFMEQANRRTRIIFSPKTIGWFFQSLFSKRSFSDLVFENTTGFLVESVYAANKQTFEPLAKVDVDEDIQSLSIIRDSISEDYHNIQVYLEEQRLTHKALNTIDFPLTTNRSAVIIEGASQITIAIVEGIISHDVVDKIQEVSDDIDERFSSELNEIYKNDDFLDHEIEEKTNGVTECLKAGLIERNAKANDQFDSCPRLAYGVIIAILLGLVGWQGYREYRWKKFVGDLESRPGIMITQLDTSWGKRTVRGIKDPGAVAPAEVAGEHGFAEKDLKMSFLPYLSGLKEYAGSRQQEIAASRERRISEVTKHVDLTIREAIGSESERLDLAIDANRQSIGSESERLDLAIDANRQSIAQYQDIVNSAIKAHEKEDAERSLRRYRHLLDLPDTVSTGLADGIFTIKGSLPEPLYSVAIDRACFLYSVEEVVSDELVNETARRIKDLSAELNAIRVPFVSGSSRPNEQTQPMMDRCFEMILELKLLAQFTHQNVEIHPRAIPLTGEYDEGNAAIVKSRMNYMKRELFDRGLAAHEIMPFEWDEEPEDPADEGRGLYLGVVIK